MGRPLREGTRLGGGAACSVTTNNDERRRNFAHGLHKQPIDLPTSWTSASPATVYNLRPDRSSEWLSFSMGNKVPCMLVPFS